MLRKELSLPLFESWTVTSRLVYIMSFYLFSPPSVILVLGKRNECQKGCLHIDRLIFPSVLLTLGIPPVPSADQLCRSAGRFMLLIT